jgi:ACS family hexuronate transporter-like MFS transporter
MFASTVLSYLDRQAVTLVRPYIQAEFGLRTLLDFGWVIAAFQLTYALFQVPAGYLADRSNVRFTYALAVGFWSLAAAAMAFVPTLGQLVFCRAFLGLWESFNWPCALRVTSRILPPQDRSLGNGIFNSGAAVGAVLTPLIITPLTLKFGWRVAFFLVGSIGAIWVVVWLVVMGGAHHEALSGAPNQNAGSKTRAWNNLPVLTRTVFGGVALSSTIVALTAFWAGLAALWWGIACLMVGMLIAPLVLPRWALHDAEWTESLGEIVRSSRFWVLVLVSVSINVCWHFQVNWMPTYLKEFRGMSFLSSGLWSAVPFLAADVGNLGGGAWSRWLVGRGWSVVPARRAVMTLCIVLIACGVGVDRSRNNAMVIVLLGLMALGTAAFMANYFAFTQEVLPRHTGLIVGILGGLGNLFAAGFHPVAGRIADITASFESVFLFASLLPFVGIVALWSCWGEKTTHTPEPSALA